MLKRILIALAVAILLQTGSGLFLETPIPAYAEDPAAPAPGESLDSPTFMFDLSSITHKGIQGSTRQSWIRRGINYFFERIIGFMATVIGSLAVLVLTYGGFMILTAGGEDDRIQKGKQYAYGSLIGLGITLMAYIMVTLVQLLVVSIYA